MLDREALLTLGDRLRSASGPDRDLDAGLAEAFDKRPPGAPSGGRMFKTTGRGRAVERGDLFIQIDHFNNSYIHTWHAEPFTESIDDAVALLQAVLPGAWWLLRCGAGGEFVALVRASDIDEQMRAPTAPLALCAAIVAAKLREATP
jgi:hypothetical protein